VLLVLAQLLQFRLRRPNAVHNVFESLFEFSSIQNWSTRMLKESVDGFTSDLRKRLASFPSESLESRDLVTGENYRLRDLPIGDTLHHQSVIDWAI